MHGGGKMHDGELDMANVHAKFYYHWIPNKILMQILCVTLGYHKLKNCYMKPALLQLTKVNTKQLN